MKVDKLIEKWEAKHTLLLTEYSKNASSEEVLQQLRSRMKDVLEFVEDLKQVQDQPQNLTNKKFEYDIQLEYRKNLPTDWLNKKGEDGWELVSVIPDKEPNDTKLLRYYFRHEVSFLPLKNIPESRIQDAGNGKRK